MYKIIPTYNNGEWEVTEFVDKPAFVEYILSIFSEPGLYGLNALSYEFNTEAKLFNEQGFYCNKPFRSKDFTNYWEDQKNKCREGVIYKDKNKSFFLTRDYYMWLCAISYGFI